MRDLGTHESGIGIVELFIGTTVLSVAVLGAIGALMSSLKLSIDTKNANLANDAALSVVEQFRFAAAKDFDKALTNFDGLETGEPQEHKVFCSIILDETRFDPPLDLNGDGDMVDASLSPNAVNAAYLETRVVWGRDKEMRFVSLVARNESKPIGSADESGGSTGESGSTEDPTTTDEPTTETEGSAVLTVTSASIRNDSVKSTLDSNGTAQVVAVTVKATEQSYVSEIKIGGVRVFSDKTSASPTGSLIATSTTAIEAGSNTVDLKFQTTASGGRADLSGQVIQIVLHHESGATTSYTVQ